MAQGRFIAYYRVSTAKQGRSGLGLEAQKTAVLAYLNGGCWTLSAEFTEVESGKQADRPELARALAACRLIGATLVIAKLDRLTRNVAFLANLMESGAEFVACDNPHATKFTIHILAAVAELERQQISDRTKAALAAAKARGTQLGGWKGGPIPDGRLGAAAPGPPPLCGACWPEPVCRNRWPDRCEERRGQCATACGGGGYGGYSDQATDRRPRASDTHYYGRGADVAA